MAGGCCSISSLIATRLTRCCCHWMRHVAPHIQVAREAPTSLKHCFPTAAPCLLGPMICSSRAFPATLGLPGALWTVRLRVPKSEREAYMAIRDSATALQSRPQRRPPSLLQATRSPHRLDLCGSARAKGAVQRSMPLRLMHAGSGATPPHALDNDLLRLWLPNVPHGAPRLLGLERRITPVRLWDAKFLGDVGVWPGLCRRLNRLPCRLGNLPGSKGQPINLGQGTESWHWDSRHACSRHPWAETAHPCAVGGGHQVSGDDAGRRIWDRGGLETPRGGRVCLEQRG